MTGRVSPCPAQHCRRSSPGKPAADDGNICCLKFHATVFLEINC